MGFIPDIERICKLVPFTRQTLFFSATMPPEIQKLTGQFLSNPVRVEVSKRSSTGENITQGLAASGKAAADKRAVLRELIKNATDLQNAFIFCNRKIEVAELLKSLQRHGFKTGALHGDMDQKSRMATLDAFRKGELPLLVASDVAARGLDIPAVSHVFNFDIPHHPEDYVHRIGRTGRAGRSGAAYTIVSASDDKYLKAIEELIAKKIDYLPGHDKPIRASEEKTESRGRHGKPQPQHKRERPPAAKSEQPKGEQAFGHATSKRAAAKPQPSRPKPEVEADDGNTGEMPAFLLRTVRDKAKPAKA